MSNGPYKLIRPPFVRDGVGVIRLTQGYETIVDIDVLPLLGKYNWYKCASPPPYAVRKSSRKMRADSKQVDIKLHAEVLRLHGVDIPKGMVVDHINRNSFDNRFENLRVVTQAVNVRNSDRSDNAVGVYFQTDENRNRRYRAQIRRGGKTVNLGSFYTEEEAREVYLEAKRLRKEGEL